MAMRVIRLLGSGSFTGPIQCQLIETNLGDFPYEAVSYTWGSTSKPFSITVDGCEMAVTESAFTLLRHLRLEGEDRLLWLDAICIDQENPRERSHQVGQMREIYGSAERVVFWLGTSNDHIDDFFDTMKDPRLNPLRTLGSKGLRFIPDEELRQEIRRGFLALASRSWFRRVWIVHKLSFLVWRFGSPSRRLCQRLF